MECDKDLRGQYPTGVKSRQKGMSMYEGFRVSVSSIVTTRDGKV